MMKTLFYLFVFLYPAFSQAQSNSATLIDVGNKCLAAFQRDPSASNILPLRGFCLCVAQQVASSSEDRKSATDKAGVTCLEIMKNPSAFGGGLARGQTESCLINNEIISYYPKTYQEFCTCLGNKLAEVILSKVPLSISAPTTLSEMMNNSIEMATQKCILVVNK